MTTSEPSSDTSYRRSRTFSYVRQFPVGTWNSIPCHGQMITSPSWIHSGLQPLRSSDLSVPVMMHLRARVRWPRGKSRCRDGPECLPSALNGQPRLLGRFRLLMRLRRRHDQPAAVPTIDRPTLQIDADAFSSAWSVCCSRTCEWGVARHRNGLSRSVSADVESPSRHHCRRRGGSGGQW